MLAHIQQRGIRSETDTNFGFHFAMTADERPYYDSMAHNITVPFSTNYTRTFTFDPDRGMYLVENRHGPHVDAANGEQIYVRNVLIQLTSMHIVPGDAEGRRAVQTIGEGDGWLAIDGLLWPVRWVKDAHDTPTRWYFENGAPMTLAPGRTWINVFQHTGNITFAYTPDIPTAESIYR